MIKCFGNVSEHVRQKRMQDTQEEQPHSDSSSL